MSPKQYQLTRTKYNTYLPSKLCQTYSPVDNLFLPHNNDRSIGHLQFFSFSLNICKKQNKKKQYLMIFRPLNIQAFNILVNSPIVYQIGNIFKCCHCPSSLYSSKQLFELLCEYFAKLSCDLSNMTFLFLDEIKIG